MVKKIPQIINEVRKYKLPDFDTSQHKNISFSQFQVFSQCPHQWDLNYRQGYRIYTSTIYTLFGTAFHETVQNWLTVMYEVSAVEADKINLPEYLCERMKQNYILDFKNNNHVHFTTGEELQEFLEDGIQILTYLQKNRKAYFNLKGWYLVGIETPLLIKPLPEYSSIFFKGFLDIVMYNENTEVFHIIDLKTSTRGWKDREKKSETKPMQLVLYKEYFSRQFGIPVDKVDIKFTIVKRKVWENTEYPQKRIQEWEPTSGPIKTKKALSAVESFIRECFNLDGTYKQTEKEKRPSDTACKYCPYKDKVDLCNRKSKV